MAWILLRIERFAAFETRKGDHAMLHQNIVFHSLLKHVPWHKLEQIVGKHGADKLSRKLNTKRHLIALLYGQFSGATSLREIITGMESHQTRLYHGGAAPVKRSTISDANTERPWQVFSELFTEVLKQAHRGLRRTVGDAVRLIDSTSVSTSDLSSSFVPLHPPAPCTICWTASSNSAPAAPTSAPS